MAQVEHFDASFTRLVQNDQIIEPLATPTPFSFWRTILRGAVWAQKKPVGYFVLHQGTWWFINQTLTALKDITNKCDVPPGEACALQPHLQSNDQRLPRDDLGPLCRCSISSSTAPNP
jgi:hypothetical protein